MDKKFLYPADAVILAPLSGYTDLAYRCSARRGGCRFAFTEMIDTASLTYARARSEAMLQRGDDETFLGAQLVGADHEFIRRALDVLNEYDFSVVDFNLGCPVPKVAKKGAGAELGRKVDEALACFSLFGERSRHPISAKIRILSAEDPEPTLVLCRGLAQLGARAITIHGRIKEAFYSGPVKFEFLRMVREALPEVQIIANGGIMGRASYEEMRRETGCDAVMVARGAMGNPWIFQELQELDAYVPPTLEELLVEMRTHVSAMISLYGEETAMRIARKVLHDYVKGRGFHTNVKAAISAVATSIDLEVVLQLARQSHADSYWKQLEANPGAERRLLPVGKAAE